MFHVFFSQKFNTCFCALFSHNLRHTVSNPENNVKRFVHAFPMHIFPRVFRSKWITGRKDVGSGGFRAARTSVWEPLWETRWPSGTGTSVDSPLTPFQWTTESSSGTCHLLVEKTNNRPIIFIYLVPICC